MCANSSLHLSSINCSWLPWGLYISRKTVNAYGVEQTPISLFMQQGKKYFEWALAFELGTKPSSDPFHRILTAGIQAVDQKREFLSFSPWDLYEPG